MGYKREGAARYPFLLATPAAFASGFYQLCRSWERGSSLAAGPTLLATLVAFAVGYLVIVLFMRLVSTRSYFPSWCTGLRLLLVTAYARSSALLPAVGSAAVTRSIRTFAMRCARICNTFNSHPSHSKVSPTSGMRPER